MPERHLGLVPGHSVAFLHTLAKSIAASVDLEAVLKLARTAAPWRGPGARRFPAEPAPAKGRYTLAVAQDEAFWFYYRDGLDYLAALGADLAPFSPLRDAHPPAGTDAVFLGGGYPELHLEELAANRPLLEWLRATDKPIYAECGGLMYLTRAIHDANGRRFPMAGLLPTEAFMQGQGLKLGYVEATAACDHLLARAGERVRGHEFHCSALSESSAAPAWQVQNRDGSPRNEGFAGVNILASYIHQHFAASPTAARRFTDRALLCKGG